MQLGIFVALSTPAILEHASMLVLTRSVPGGSLLCIEGKYQSGEDTAIPDNENEISNEAASKDKVK